MMKRFLMAVSMVAMVGCSGSFNGQVGGVSLSVADAAFAVLKDGTGKAFAAVLVLSDKPKICDSIKANRQLKTTTSLSFTLFRYNSAGTEFLAPDPAEYTVLATTPTAGGNYATAEFARTDSNCTPSTESKGQSGLFKLTAIKGETNGTANATYDITFGTGDKVTGSINATFCDISNLPMTAPNCE